MVARPVKFRMVALLPEARKRTPVVIRILYFSTASPNIGVGNVEEIVKSSAARNARQGITGALAFNGRNFCQVLEGDEDKVMALIEKIRQDERHSGFKILDQKEITTAYFKDWSMHRVSNLDFSTLINAMNA